VTRAEKIAEVDRVYEELWPTIWRKEPANIGVYYYWDRWKRRHSTDWRACKGFGDLAWHTAGSLSGAACPRCRSIWLNLSNLTSRADIRQTLYHELLHLRHPSWDEEKVAAEAERLQ